MPRERVGDSGPFGLDITAQLHPAERERPGGADHCFGLAERQRAGGRLSWMKVDRVDR
ncbi:MAG TPA: hypothetical protein VLP43_00975 [Solirubrobacteraceae bacterium]|nr:hypothetical protein [Solirubrobacteraceae bacterium]